ncbi:WD40 repeat domain-containing protein [Streptomyces sp. KHY 26]|uniref:WD40 repeat domain-containing protein n=1 Tax=Streptomyces sp. KHY 26 TaxID=3097359 RepID=UPI00376EBC49
MPTTTAGLITWQQSRDSERRPQAPDPGTAVSAVAISADRQTLAVARDDRTVRVVDTATGRRTVLPGRTDRVVSAAFSPDGRTLATGAEDGTGRLWDLAQRTLATPRSSPQVFLSPDGHTLATGSDDDGTARLWPVTPGDPGAAVTRICHALHRGLTAHEWARYLPGRPVRHGCAS